MSRIPYGRSGVIDPALAGFAAAALAFAAFAMPEWRLTQIVSATGLPDILAAAQPPLGLKARLGFALLLGLFSFAAFFAILRRLDRASGSAAAVDADVAPTPIRLRRSDAHPDAPPRRPLIVRDLGEPLPAEPEEEELLLAPAQAEAAAALPSFLVQQEEEEEIADEPQPVAEQEVPFAFASPAPADDAPLRAFLPEADDAPLCADVPEAEEAAALPAAAPAEPAPAVEGEESIGRLMKRLEFGLARRERAAPIDPAAIAPRTEDAVGHRLRSAISDLEKLAARG